MTDKTPVDTNERLVLAYFATLEQAEAAAKAVKDWDTSNEAVKLGAVGILSKEDGKIKTRDTGRKTGKGAAIGLGLGALAAVLTGGIGLIAGLVGGSVLGGATGSLFKKSLGLTPEDFALIEQNLDAGQVAVVVMCDDYEVDGVVADMKQHNGEVKTFAMSSADLPATAEAVTAVYGPADQVTDAAASQMDDERAQQVNRLQ